MLYAGTPREERERRSEVLLEEVGLATRMDHKPHELWAASSSGSR